MGPINGSEPAEFRKGITRQRALELLEQDARVATDGVRRLIRVPLKQHQLDALISFTFNCGKGSLQTSTLRKRLNAGEYDAVPIELRRWVFSVGKKLPGLVRRRQAEGALFNQGRYQ
jgi:lysozyme